MLIGIDASRIAAARMTGTERYAREVVDALLRDTPDAGHRFRLYTRGDPMPARAALAVDDDPRVEWRAIDARRLWTHLGLAREMRRDPPDALFIPAHVLPLAFAQARLRARVRTVVTIHDCGFKFYPQAHPPRQRWYLDWSTRFAARHASALITDSAATRDDLLALYGVAPHVVRVAHPALKPLPEIAPAQAEAALARVGVRPGGYALHIGTQHRRKNLARLIEAWACSGLATQAGFQLVIAGAPGYGADDLRVVVDRLDLGASVLLTGYIDDATRAALLRGARAYIFPSLYEGFGFGVLEAQSVDVPVACSRTSSLGEVAGDAALTFDPESIESMCGAIRRVMTDEVSREALRTRGRANLARFSWRRCATVVLDALTGDAGVSN